MKATMLDIVTLEQDLLPEQNYERACHTSIILSNHLFLVGGIHPIVHDVRLMGSIESLNLLKKSSWHILIENNVTVERQYACIVAISATKFLVAGGSSFDYR